MKTKIKSNKRTTAKFKVGEEVFYEFEDGMIMDSKITERNWTGKGWEYTVESIDGMDISSGVSENKID